MTISVRNKANIKGVALVGVLWLLLLLSTLVLSLCRETRLATKTTQVYLQEVQSQALIEGVVHEAIFGLLKGLSISELQRKMASHEITLIISGPGSQLNINTASVNELESLLSEHSIPEVEKLASRIADFRERGNGTQTSSKKAFNHVFDLAQVSGISVGTLKSLIDNITVLEKPNNGRIISLLVTTERAKISTGANVTVKLTGAVNDPYRILSWDWTAG